MLERFVYDKETIGPSRSESKPSRKCTGFRVVHDVSSDHTQLLVREWVVGISIYM